MNEDERVAMLARVLGDGVTGVTLGIGDDAAVLEAPRESLVWSLDASVEHVHFERAWLDGEALGYRATMAAFSDLAAMGARPLGALAGLVLPTSLDDAWFEAIARGQRRAADALGTAVVGGNLSRGSELSITTTVLGASARPLRRSGASVDDVVWLAGAVGLARAGLEALLRGIEVPDAYLDAWRHPVARIEAGLAIAGVATSAIDVSDGLARDAARLAEASDVRLSLDEDALVDEALRRAAARVKLEPIELALYGGEDYAILFTAPSRASFDGGFRRIGRVRARGEGPRLVLERQGRLEPIEPLGFDHFR